MEGNDTETPSGGEPGQDPGQRQPTPVTDGGRAAELEAALAEQRRIQGGLDKQITDLRTNLATERQEKEQLLVKINELSGQQQAATNELQQLKERAIAQEAELGELKGKASVYEAEAQRAKIVAGV